jgi:hypothetical protein
MAGLGSHLAELDLPAEPFLHVGEQDRVGVALGVFEVDADGVAIGEAHVGHDRAGADVSRWLVSAAMHAAMTSAESRCSSSASGRPATISVSPSLPIAAA